MIELAYSRYISNIPWNDYKHQIFSENIEEYIQNMNHVLGEYAAENPMIDFEDDVWDFSPYRKDVEKSGLKIDLSKADPCYRSFLKFFLIQRLSERLGIRSIIRTAKNVIEVMEAVIAEKRIKSVSLISDEDIISFVLRKNLSPNTQFNLIYITALFLEFTSCNFRIPVLIDYGRLYKVAKEIGRESYGDSKTPTIPDEFFEIIKTACMKALHDESLPLNVRMTAGAILLEGQTGIRNEDLMNIKTTDVKEVTYSGFTYHYLDFETRKPSKSDTYFRHCRCRLNALCMDAVDTMIELGKPIREKAGVDFLYVLEMAYSNAAKEITFPVGKSRFRKQYVSMMIRLIPEECEMEWEGVSTTVVHGKKLSIPSMRQYRVFVCSDLYRKGASLACIMKTMGHLSSAMEGYYVRQKDTWQDARAEAARQIIKAVTEEKTVPVGNPKARQMDHVITKVVDDTKVNIAASSEEIIGALGKELIVRTKPGGFCIRTGRTCAEDYKTDQILCAYDECPNIFYFYFNIATAYDDMRNAEQTYQSAISAGHKREAEKEKYKIVNIAKRRIIPMLDELERLLTTSTPEEIEERHPGMAETIRRKDEIRKEAMDWIAKTE